MRHVHSPTNGPERKHHSMTDSFFPIWIAMPTNPLLMDERMYQQPRHRRINATIRTGMPEYVGAVALPVSPRVTASATQPPPLPIGFWYHLFQDCRRRDCCGAWRGQGPKFCPTLETTVPIRSHNKQVVNIQSCHRKLAISTRGRPGRGALRLTASQGMC